MKSLFVELRKKVRNDIDLSLLDSINGKSVSLAGTIQYLDYIPIVKRHLEKIGKIVKIKQGAFYDAHIIGCNPSAFDVNADCLLLLADGKFHAINNARKLNKEILVFNLIKLEKITKKDIEEENKKIKGKQTRLISASKIGLIVSNKHGQNVGNIERIADRIHSDVYIFETDNLVLNELENFPDIKMWINTACYGIDRDSPNLINLSDALEVF